MNKPKNELKVGLTVIISLVILIGGTMWGKGYGLKMSRYPIEVDFKNVGGLEVGSDVLANGVKRGRLQEITLYDGKVSVKADIEKNVKIYSDYKITIESPTLMAGKVLSIYPGSKLPLVDTSKPLKGDEPLGVGEAVATVQALAGDFKTTLDNLNKTLVSLNQIVGDTANQRNLSETMANTAELTKNSNEWLKENKADLSESVDKLQVTLDEAQKLFKNLDTNVNTTLTNFDSTLSQINALTGSLKDISEGLKKGEGTMGKLIASDELYNRLNHTLAEVDSLAHSIRTKGLRNKIVLF